MGYVPVVSPTAQFMVTQAVLNVMQGERYKTVPDELRKYCLGYYGQPPAPIAPELMDRAVRRRRHVRHRTLRAISCRRRSSASGGRAGRSRPTKIC
jgi:pyruvate/oxaloacetate carboxyltransferase